MLKRFTIETADKVEFISITDQIKEIVEEADVESGLLQVYIPHTTAAVTIIGYENSNIPNSDIIEDIKFEINKLDDDFGHLESEASSAHLKSSYFGVDLTFIVEDNKLLLGENQDIHLGEFAGPRTREVVVKVMAEK